MAIKSILTSQTDFTGEFPVSEKTVALWRFNEAAPDSNNMLTDDSGHNRNFFVSGWSGTSANLLSGRLGRYFRQNIINPTSEKTHLVATNAYCINEKKAIKLLETFEHKPEKYTEKVNHIFEVLGISLFECYDMTEKLYNEVNEIVSEINNFLNEESSDERKQI